MLAPMQLDLNDADRAVAIMCAGASPLSRPLADRDVDSSNPFKRSVPVTR